jgi:hypothetical protein
MTAAHPTATRTTPLRSVSEAEGGAATEWRPSGRPCRRCKVAGRCYARAWGSDDGAHADEEYQCRSCGAVWWIEGPDSWFARGRSALAAVFRRLGNRMGG